MVRPCVSCWVPLERLAYSTVALRMCTCLCFGLQLPAAALEAACNGVLDFEQASNCWTVRLMHCKTYIPCRQQQLMVYMTGASSHAMISQSANHRCIHYKCMLISLSRHVQQMSVQLTAVDSAGQVCGEAYLGALKLFILKSPFMPSIDMFRLAEVAGYPKVLSTYLQNHVAKM